MGEFNWFVTAYVLMIMSAIAYLIRLVKPNWLNQEGLWFEAGWGTMALSLLCLGVSLTIRSQKAEYFALSNMYESLLVVLMSVQIGFLVMERWFKIRSLGFSVALLILIALWYDSTLPTEIKPLQPALQSYWRSIHVPVILMSYALFTLAFLSSLVYLIKAYFFSGQSGGHGASQKLQPADGPSLYAQNTERITDQTLAMDLNQEIEALAIKEPASIYDEMTYRCVAFGVPMLTVGIILGGMWANEAWGNYWSWDPKESMSLVLLLAYGVYLHLRVNAQHSAKTLAWVSVTAFALMLVTYFGVNLMGVGLHSYGKIG